MISADDKAGGDPDAGRVLSEAVARITELSVMSNAKLGTILGLPESTAAELCAGRYQLESETMPFERARHLLQLFHSLNSWLSHDDVSVRSWLASPNLDLGTTPAKLIMTAEGLLRTKDYVECVRMHK